MPNSTWQWSESIISYFSATCTDGTQLTPITVGGANTSTYTFSPKYNQTTLTAQTPSGAWTYYSQ